MNQSESAEPGGGHLQTRSGRDPGSGMSISTTSGPVADLAVLDSLHVFLLDAHRDATAVTTLLLQEVGDPAGANVPVACISAGREILLHRRGYAVTDAAASLVRLDGLRARRSGRDLSCRSRSSSTGSTRTSRSTSVPGRGAGFSVEGPDRDAVPDPLDGCSTMPSSTTSASGPCLATLALRSVLRIVHRIAVRERWSKIARWAAPSRRGRSRSQQR